MKGFFKSLLEWETYAILGVLILFVVVGYYAKYYEGDDETIKYSLWTAVIISVFFLAASFISWKKRKKREKEINQKYGAGNQN